MYLKVSITFAATNTGVAQLVEHRSPKPGVGSSSLSSRARVKKAYSNNISFSNFKRIDTSCRAPYASIDNACQLSARQLSGNETKGLMLHRLRMPALHVRLRKNGTKRDIKKDLQTALPSAPTRQRRCRGAHLEHVKECT